MEMYGDSWRGIYPRRYLWLRRPTSKYSYLWSNPKPNQHRISILNPKTYRHDDDETRRDVGVEQMVTETPLQLEDHLQACEVTWNETEGNTNNFHY